MKVRDSGLLFWATLYMTVTKSLTLKFRQTNSRCRSLTQDRCVKLERQSPGRNLLIERPKFQLKGHLATIAISCNKNLIFFNKN